MNFCNFFFLGGDCSSFVSLFQMEEIIIQVPFIPFSTTDIQRGQRLENFFSNKRFFPSLSLSLYLPFSLLFSKLFTRPHLFSLSFQYFLSSFSSCSAFRLDNIMRNHRRHHIPVGIVCRYFFFCFYPLHS